VLVLLAGGAAWAQDTALGGAVTDPTGALIPGATVTITNEATRAVRTTTTGEDGRYLITQLDPGHYKVEVKSAGFKTAVRESLDVPIGLTSRFDIMLQVGEVTETVTVESDTARVNTTDASLGNPLSREQVLRLPSLNLDPAGLLSLQTGVTFIGGKADNPGGYSGTTDMDTRTGSVSGSRSDQTNITLDGADVNDPQNGFAFTSTLRSTQASLQEFRVTTTNYNADQGRSGAAQVQLVTRSGSNEIHGDAYYAHRNEIFNANDFFLNRSGTDRPKFRRHIYGAALGAPIVKDRLFIFGNWEELRENLTTVAERDIPSASFRDGVLIYECTTTAGYAACPATSTTVLGASGASYTVPAGFYGLSPAELAAIDPLGIGPGAATLAHFNQYACASGGTCGNSSGGFDSTNIVGFTFAAPIDNFFRTWVARADFNIDRNSRHTLYWRGTLHDDNFVRAAPQFPNEPFNQTEVNGNRGFALGYRALFGNNVVNTLRWGYTRISGQVAGQQQTEYVNFRFLNNLQDYESDTFSRILPQHHIANDTSWTSGKHTISFGGEMRTTRTDTANNGNSFHFFTGNPSWLPAVGRNTQPGSAECIIAGCFLVPDVSAGGAASYNDAVVTLLGLITQATASYNFDRTGATLPTGELVQRNFAVNEYELYAQDQWRIHPSLTITVGLRYSMISPPWETNGNQVAPTLFDKATGQIVPGGLNEWFEIRRQLMLNGIGTDKAPQIQFSLAGPENNGPHYYEWDWNNLSPRVAFAWSPKYSEGLLGKFFGGGKMVVRGGYSLVYDRVGPALIATFDANGAFGMSTGIDSTFAGCDEGPGVGAPGSLGTCPRFATVFDTAAATALLLPPSPGGGFPTAPPGADLFGNLAPGAFAISQALDNGITSPYAHVMNLSIARELPGNMSLEVGYVGRRGRNGLIVRDLAMPADLCDPASGGCYFEQARSLLAMADSGPFIGSLQPIPYWENLFPSFGPSGINGGALPCDVEGLGPGTYSATQVAADWMLCSHPDTTVFPWTVDNFDFPGYVLGAPTDPDVDGDGFPDAPFAFFDDQFATVTAWTSLTRSEYHGMQLSFRKRMSHGLQFDFNYTFAKSLDQSSAAERSSAGFGFELGAGYSGSTINSWEPEQEYSFSDFDIRHQMNLNWIYELPIGRGRALGSGMNAFWNAIIGGWEISGIVRANSGLPANFINARVWPTNWNLQGNPTCGNRLTNANVAPCPGTQNVSAATHSGVTQSSPNIFADPDAAFDGFRFTLPGQRGERNVVRGDNYVNFDFSLAKRFNMPWEGHSMLLRWEAFNAFNQVYFDTGFLTGSIGQRTTFGNYTQTLGNPRQMQISLRYSF
jgi:hypothetical protein